MKPITIVAICVICAATLMSGCMETTTTVEGGTGTYNIVTGHTVTAIDMYQDGVHITGTGEHDGDEIVSMVCNVDGYIDGNHVTGSHTYTDAGGACYDLYMEVDYYQSDGHHVTGYKTLKGGGDDVEWYKCLTATKDGYKTQYMNGYDDAEWRT